MASAAEQLAANLNFGAFAKADALKKQAEQVEAEVMQATLAKL